jgi:hypothetical protein
METAIAIAHPLLRKLTIGTHLFVAGWILLNGVAHSVQVLYKAQKGTLAAHHDLTSLLLVGAGLIVAAAALSLGAPALMRAVQPSIVPALAGLGVFGVVIAGTAAVYGFTFLGGSITLFTIDLALLAAHRAMNG